MINQQSEISHSNLEGLFATFSLWEGLYLLRFSHYNFAPAEGGGVGETRRSPLPEKSRILFATFYSMKVFFAKLFTIGGPFCFVFFIGGLFCLYGVLFVLPPLTQFLLLNFLNKMLVLKSILCRVPIIVICIARTLDLYIGRMSLL